MKKIEHRVFRDIANYLRSGDVLVRNNTKVIPARLRGRKTTGGKVEVLLLHGVGAGNGESGLGKTSLGKTARQADLWWCLTKPGLKVGMEVAFSAKVGDDSSLQAVVGRRDKERALLQFNQPHGAFMRIITEIGDAPLPPYIGSGAGCRLPLSQKRNKKEGV